VCGICGVAHYDTELPGDRSLLRQMTDILGHRGPDSQGVHVGPGIGLGVTRLAINDLQSGDQPIFNENGTIGVVCNGEIYNFHELRRKLESGGHQFSTRSDVEVIVHLYEDHGVDCVHSLRGMFGFALWDGERRQLMLARDRLGIKPLHYAVERDGIYFGSEYKAILATERLERQIDVQALRDLFTMGFVMTPRTLFTRIQTLPAGTYLLYRHGSVSTHQYWDMTFPTIDEELPRMSLDDWAEALREKLEESVRLHLRSDVPVGAWLSSGVDSSSVVALMTRLTDTPVQTFSLAFENPRINELDRWPTLDRFQPSEIQNHVTLFDNKSFELYPKFVWHSENPEAGIDVARLMLSKLTSENVKVFLTGEGSDEIFGGYPWFRADKLFQTFRRFPPSILKPIAGLSRVSRRWEWVAQFVHPSLEMNIERYIRMVGTRLAEDLENLFSDDVKSLFRETRPSYSPLVRPEQLDGRHPFLKLQYIEAKTRLVDLINHGLDRSSMAYSVEARLPFLDH
jgi:asparagine synthase (glutamine-hydrolysing)